MILLSEVWPEPCSSARADGSRSQTSHGDQGFGEDVKSGQRTSPIPNWSPGGCLVVISLASCSVGTWTHHIRMSFTLQNHQGKDAGGAKRSIRQNAEFSPFCNVQTFLLFAMLKMRQHKIKESSSHHYWSPELVSSNHRACCSEQGYFIFCISRIAVEPQSWWYLSYEAWIQV